MVGGERVFEFSPCLIEPGARAKLLSSLDIFLGKREFGKSDFLVTDGDFLLTRKE
jgi:hypothetical protein